MSPGAAGAVAGAGGLLLGSGAEGLSHSRRAPEAEAEGCSPDAVAGAGVQSSVGLRVL